MEFAVGYYQTVDALDPGSVARLVEEHGFGSLFLPDHSHVPAGDTQQPALTRRSASLYDMFVALTAAAAATSRLRVVSSVCLVVQRDPITTAKEVASLDHLSGGRFEFGVGLGWRRQEMRDHGTDPRTRVRLMAERIEAMKAIWTQQEASYAGEFVAFERLTMWPKPVQRPHPPILVGGDGPTVVDRVLAYGDAWLPNYAHDDRAGMDILERAKDMWARADRPIDLMVVRAPADAAALERLRTGGVSRAIHWLPSTGRAGMERALERWESAIAELDGEA